jgi:uncharacterized membrane protein
VVEYFSLINDFDRQRSTAYFPIMSQSDLTGPSFFDATLRPHRSLEPHGFVLLMTVIAGFSFVSGMIFVLHGAWPVMGFFGLDVFFVYIAFRANYRAADASERIVLSEVELLVERHRRGQLVGRWSFQPYWLRIEVIEDPRPAVVLRSHGNSLAIASFLSPDERAGFAQALSDSIAELRTAPHLRS